MIRCSILGGLKPFRVESWAFGGSWTELGKKFLETENDEKGSIEVKEAFREDQWTG